MIRVALVIKKLPYFFQVKIFNVFTFATGLKIPWLRFRRFEHCYVIDI